jgi:uncharacterized protein YfaS (alpha-2-macroglobulin family)
VFSFNTGGPAIKRADPWEGSTVDENQAFVLNVDAQADPASIREHAYFLVEGLSEKVPVAVLDYDPRQPQTLTDRFKSKVRAWATRLGYPASPRKAGDEALPVVALQAKQRFPANAKVTLVWGAGIRTLGGVATSADQSIEYTVRPEFKAEMNCERENAEAACTPISPIVLQFSADIAWGDAQKIRLRSPSGKEWKPFVRAGDNLQEDSPVSTVTFPAPLPAMEKFQILVPKNLKDDSGRALSNASRFPLEVATADFPPLLKFSSDFGIVELKPEAVLPVTVRNLEAVPTGALDGKVARFGEKDFKSMLPWLGTMTERPYYYAKRDESIFTSHSHLKTETVSLPRSGGAKAFEVLGVPFRKPGFYLVEFKSKNLGQALLGKDRPMYVSAGALVTNLSVHFKKGRESSLVWVTALDSGQPVAGASVSIRDCSGSNIGHGVTDQQGLWRISSSIDGVKHKESCSGQAIYGSGLFAVAEKDGDFSFVHTSWSKGIESWRFNFPERTEPGSEIATTVFDRTLFRAGEIVHMKHFFRLHSGRGIQAPPTADLPKAVRIAHQESGQSFEQPLEWRGDVAESTWAIPASAKLGDYTVSLLRRAGKPEQAGSEAGENPSYDSPESSQAWTSGEFKVEEFRLPLLKGKISPPAENLISLEDVPVDVLVEYLAGGAAAKLPVHIRHNTFPVDHLDFPDFEDYEFATGKARKPGDEADAPSASTSESLTLDSAGGGHARLAVAHPKTDRLQDLQVELEYPDPNGEIQTVSRTIPIYPASRIVGIRPDSWVGSKSSLKFKVAVVDLHGKPVPHAAVDVDLLEEKTYSHRKRLVGGFYAYENRSELNHVGAACHGETDSLGLLACDTKPAATGNLILEARTSDEAGRVAYAHSSTWVYDTDEWWFSQEDSDRIDLLPEKKHYEPGEKAVFQVRMPFREATALVSVEREGVIDAFTVPLTAKKPLIEVPIKDNYGPNVFVSALVVRGRVGDPQPTALIDLGRPAYKLGIAEINVGWKPHELKVRVIPSKETYQVRENGTFKIHVETADGHALPKGSELALAAVDEGLLELKSNQSWKLLEAMMSRRGYEVETFTAQSQVIGKRHFGLKALAQGGDGGKSSDRELLNSLLYWQSDVKLDDDGNAQVSFPMNDSITSFRIAAVAHAGEDLFGTGYASIRTTQNLMILSGIPPLARAGDHFSLELTLRNTTRAAMSVDLSGKAPGVAGLDVPHLALAAGESKVVHWPIDIPAGAASLEYQLEARDSLSANSDRLRITQNVIEAVPTRVVQATLTQVTGPYELPIEKPKDALAGKGGVRVLLSASLLTGLDGVRDYMTHYPYGCMEQRTSKAIALQDQKLWAQTMADLPNYLDSDGLVRYFPSGLLKGSDVLSAYLLSIANEAGWKIPDESLRLILGGLEKFVNGQIQNMDPWELSDLTARKISALEALSRYHQIDWKQAASIEQQPGLWPTSSLIDWKLYLGRLDQTLSETPEIQAKKKEADQILRSRLDFQGTRMGFSTESSDELRGMMVSIGENANRLLLAVLSDGAWRDDLGRIARGALEFQRQAHWETTTANAWGVLAVRKFAAQFEKTPVAGETTVALASQSSTQDWKESLDAKPIDLDWPASKENLKISHTGPGNPWAVIQSRAAIPLREPLFTGYRVRKSLVPVEQKTAGKWSRGDIIRVHLELESQADMTWVVVDDPIPAGATILGSGLGNDSGIAAGGEKSQGWATPAFQERGFSGYRAYYQFVPKGQWTVEYTLRLNQVGHMNLPATHVEAMYAPEMLGELPNEAISIQP